MKEKSSTFRFKKQKKGKWDLLEAVDIIFGEKEVGYIQETEDGKWRIRLQAIASEKALAANPNCPWMWVRAKAEFDSAEDAKKWLKENCETLIRKVCYVEG